MQPDQQRHQPLGLPEFVLDGTCLDDPGDFFTAVTTTLRAFPWGRNLDALNDILRAASAIRRNGPGLISNWMPPPTDGTGR